MLSIRQATMADLPTVMNLINSAIKVLAERQIPQWHDGKYPLTSDFENDINHGEGYVLVDEDLDSKIIGYAALSSCPDKVYEEGSEVNFNNHVESNYMIVHRVVVDSSVKGKRIGLRFLEMLQAQANELEYHDLRIDTHPKNIAMRKTIMRAGYEEVGMIYLPEVADNDRVAYQLLTRVRI
ncbi:GNAT family N-acetyltransferase [Holzapfeliella floricola]|nr:GNAT family N-acetyltransferase [Holzapfeliella floricola]